MQITIEIPDEVVKRLVKNALKVGWVERSGTQHLHRVPLRSTRPTKKWRRYFPKNRVSEIPILQYF